MADLKNEEDDFESKFADLLPDTSEQSAPGADEEVSVDDFFARNPHLDPNGTLSEETPDTVTPVGGGRTGEDVTAEVKAKQEVETPDRFDDDTLYGQKPGLGLMDRAVAGLGDVVDKAGVGDGKPNYAQELRAEVDAEREGWLTEAMETYEEIGTPDGEGNRTRLIPKLDSQGNQVVDENGKWEFEEILIPHPEDDQTGRVLWQAAQDIYQQWGGLATEGAVMAESDFEKDRPDYQLTGGEAIVKDIIAIGTPVAGASGLIRLGQKAIRKGADIYRGIQGANVARGGSTSGAIAADTLGSAIAETVMSETGDSGMVISPEMVSEWSKNGITDTQAESTAMFLDAMLVNGALDGILRVTGAGMAMAGQKTKGLGEWLSPAKLNKAVQDGTVMNVVNVLDPTIADLPPKQMARRLGTLSRVLNEESIRRITVGETSKDIQADTTTAIMGGAEAYIRETRQHLREGRTPEEFEELVQKEAGEMTSRMIGLLRSQQGSAAVTANQGRMANEMGEVMREEGRRIAGGDINAASEEATGNLVDLRNRERLEAEGNLASVDSQIADVDAALGSLLESNPMVQDIIGDVPGDLRYSEEAARRQITKLVEDRMLPEYIRTWDEVDAAYRAIPNAPIDAGMLKDTLSEVARAANSIDGSGSKARTILRDLYEGFEPRPKSNRNDPLSDPREASRITEFETVDEVIDRIQDEIGFQDLYEIKGRLAKVIKNTDDADVRGRLIDFRDSITSPDGQLGYVRETSDDLGVAEAAIRADTLFKDAASRFRNEDNIQALGDKMEAARQGRTTIYENGEERGVPAAIVKGVNETIPTALADDSGRQVKQIQLALGNSTTAEEFASPFVQLEILRGARQLSKAIDSGDTQTANMLQDAFGGLRELEERLGVQTGLSDEIDRITDQTRSADGGLRAVRGDLEASRSSIETRIKEAEDNILSRLMSPNRKGSPVSDPSRVFSELLTGNDSANAIRAMQEQARKLPAEQQQQALDTIRANALETLATRAFGNTPTGMKNGNETYKNAALGRVGEMSEDVSNNLQNGLRQAFGAGEEEAMQIADILGSVAEVSVPSRLQLNSAGSDTAANINVRDAVSTSTLLLFGYMNPVAATARRLTASSIKAAEQSAKNIRSEVLEAAISRPRDLAIMLDMVRRKEDPGVIRDHARGFLEAIGSAAGAGARYELRVDEKDDEEAPEWLR